MNRRSALNDRNLPLKGVENFRDYGGYVCTGGRLRRGMLFRSAQHCGATEDDLARIAALNLMSVIDLRGGGERSKAPCRRADDFTAEVFSVDGDTTGIAPHMEAARAAARGALSAAQVRQVMIDGYAAMPFRPHLLRIMRYYFAALAQIPGPSLIHCAAGKDRTGLAVALFHTMLGVHHDDVAADYVMTNSQSRVDERLAAGATLMRAAFGKDLSDEALRAIMLVEPAYIDAAFAEIDVRCGSLDGYLRDELHVTDAKREAMVSHLVTAA